MSFRLFWVTIGLLLLAAVLSQSPLGGIVEPDSGIDNKHRQETP